MAQTPYTKQYEKIKDLDQFFSYSEQTKTMTFIGSELIAIMPLRYEVYNFLMISDTVTSLGIMDLLIDGKYQCGLLLLTTIEMEADEVSKIVIDNVQYLKVTLSHGSRFICNTERIADSSIIYAMWMEFITRGKLLYNIDYKTLATLFDTAGTVADQNINVDHVIFEVIYSHLCRNPENLTIQHRYDKSGSDDFKMIALRDVGYATSSTTSRVLGSYFTSALNSSLIQTVDTHTDVEDLLRA